MQTCLKFEPNFKFVLKFKFVLLLMLKMLCQLLCMLGDQSLPFCDEKLIVVKFVLQMSSKARVNRPISKQVFFNLL